MAALLDNPTFAADFQPLLTALIADPNDGPTQQTFVTNLGNLLNQWTANSALGAQVVAQNALLQQLLTQFLAIGIKGTVDTVADLPTNAPPGSAYVVTSTGVGYASINGQWVSIGTLQGPPGVTATVSIGEVTTTPPGQPASVTNAGTPSAAVLQFSIPQGAPGETPWTPTAGNTDLELNFRYAVDTSAAWTMTLPPLSTCAPGDQIDVADAFGLSETNAITVNPSGSDTITAGSTVYSTWPIQRNFSTTKFIAWLEPGASGSTPTTWRPVLG